MVMVEPIRSKFEIKRIEKFLANKSTRDLLIFTLGTNSGLRISDILALDVKDVRGKKFISIVEKKTGKLKRFPLNTKLEPLIKKFIRGKDDEDPLFTSMFQNRLERFAAYNMLKEACKKAGVEGNIGTHTMRKTFGYHHYRKFKDIAMLQKIFNHSSPQITMRYIGIDQDKIDECYKKFVL